MNRYLAIPLLLLLAAPAAAQDDDPPTIDDVAADALDAVDALDRADERIDAARRAGEIVGEELGWDYQTLRDAEERERERQAGTDRQRARIGDSRDRLGEARERAEDPAGLLSWGAGYLDEITAAGASVLLGAGGLAGVNRVRKGRWVGGRDRHPNTSPRGDEPYASAPADDPLEIARRRHAKRKRDAARQEVERRMDAAFDGLDEAILDHDEYRAGASSSNGNGRR